MQSYIKIHANFLNIKRNDLRLNTALIKNIKCLVNHYLIFAAKKLIYDTTIAANYSVFQIN